MKVVIAGSRGINDYEVVAQAVAESGFEVTLVISGHARGVDLLGEQWALKHDKPYLRMPADWQTYGKSAGPIRNQRMGEFADAAVIVWDGKSRGTRNMTDVMRRLDKPYYVKVVRDEKEEE